MKVFMLLLTAMAALAVSSGGAALAQDAPRVRAIRVTTGQVKISGWEQQFIDRDPNLAHFNWVPMTATLQGMRTIAAPAAGPALVSPSTGKTSNSAYVHAPTEVSGGPRYVKPVHVPTVVEPKPEHARTVNQGIHGRLLTVREGARTARAVAGQMTAEQVAGRLEAPTRVATYPEAAGGPGRRAQANGVLESKSVYGRITGLGR